jgi:hypothetical protein
LIKFETLLENINGFSIGYVHVYIETKKNKKETKEGIFVFGLAFLLIKFETFVENINGFSSGYVHLFI